MVSKRLAAIPLAILVVCFARGQGGTQSSLQSNLHAKLEAGLLREAEGLDGVMGYFIQDLATGETFEHNAELVFPTASTIKLTVLLELMRQDQEGKLSLDEKHTVRRNETAAGDPILYMLGDGTVTMTLIFRAIGLDLTYIPVLLTVDWFLDRCRTAINIMGDVNVSCLLDGYTREARAPTEQDRELAEIA